MAGGFCGLLVQVGGDLDYLAKWLNVPRWSNHAKPCGLCPATFRGTNSWMDNRPNAGWLEAGLSCDHWVSSCPLFNVPGVDGTNISPDYMHNMFLGWLQYLYGSIFYLLVFVLLAGSPLSKLSQVEAFIRSHQKNNDVKYKYKPRLTKLSMFLKKTGYPRLRGRASDIMGLHHAMLDVWKAHMQEENVHHRRIRLLLDLNHQIANLLDEFHPRYGYLAVPENEHKKLMTKGLSMAQLHSQILEHFKDEGTKVFNMTSKTHFALHSLQLAVYIHPALVWCFKGESTMHSMQYIWKSCLPGTKHFGVSVKAAWKYRHLMHIRDAKL